MNISYYIRYFGNCEHYLTWPIYPLSINIKIKYKDHDDRSSIKKNEYYFSGTIVQQVSHQRILTIMNKSYVYFGLIKIFQNKQICA